MTRDQPSAPYAFNGLDRIFHERARLGIVTSLAGQPEGLSFAQLKKLCGLTDGNLNRHLLVLEEANCVSIRKDSSRGRTLTSYRLTSLGRERFIGYLAELELALVEGTQAATKGHAPAPRPA